MPGKLRVTLVKSPVSHNPANRATVTALGLHRIGETVEIDDTPACAAWSAPSASSFAAKRSTPARPRKRQRHEAARSAAGARLAPAAHARRPRHRRRPGQDRRPRHEGPERSRAGAAIPAWFEGGQTPIHVRVPKLRGFRNRFKVEYAVVNVGQISAYAEAGRFGVEAEQPKAAKAKASDQPVVTVNAEVLANAGLIRGDSKPVKVLGQGEVSHKLFVAAEAFSASARAKIEAAGGFVQLLAAEGARARGRSRRPRPDAAAPSPKSAPEPKSAPKAARQRGQGRSRPPRPRPPPNRRRPPSPSLPQAATAAGRHGRRLTPAAKPRRRAAKSDETA